MDNFNIPDPGPPRDDYRPKPMDRYNMSNPGLPRDDYQQRPPVCQAEMQPPPAMMQQNNPPPGVARAGSIPVFPNMPTYSPHL